MAGSTGKKLAIWVLLAGVVSLAMGAFFVAQGFVKSSMITQAMMSENISYGSAEGKIIGAIDTPEEALAMAMVLKEHRATSYGNYTQLKRDDPGRQQILNAMTMENALTLAQMGYGLTDVVKANGAFMVLIGLTLVATGASALWSGRKMAQLK